MRTAMIALFGLVLCGSWVACTGSAAQDSAPASAQNPGKSDVFGNGQDGADCAYDWQCSSDEGLTCLPTDIWYRSKVAHRCGPPGTGRTDADGGSTLQLCDDSNDCESGYRCHYEGEVDVGYVGYCVNWPAPNP